MNEQAKFYKALELLGIKPSPKYKHKPVDLGRDPDSELKAAPIMRNIGDTVCLNGANDIAGVIAHLVETHNEMVDKGAFNVKFEVYADDNHGYIHRSGDIPETKTQVVERLERASVVEKRKIAEINNNYDNLKHFEARKKDVDEEVLKAKKALQEEKAAQAAKKAKDDLEKARAIVAELESKQAHGEMDDAMESGKIS
jgi:hypothetical protein